MSNTEQLLLDYIADELKNDEVSIDSTVFYDDSYRVAYTYTDSFGFEQCDTIFVDNLELLGFIYSKVQ